MSNPNSRTEKLLLTLALPWIGVYYFILGIAALVQAGRFVSRLPITMRETVFCPLGHEIQAVSFWRCQCGAAIAGHAFSRCAHCGEVAGRVDSCPTCGLSIRNPALR